MVNNLVVQQGFVADKNCSSEQSINIYGQNSLSDSCYTTYYVLFVKRYLTENPNLVLKNIHELKDLSKVVISVLSWKSVVFSAFVELRCFWCCFVFVFQIRHG